MRIDPAKLDKAVSDAVNRVRLGMVSFHGDVFPSASGVDYRYLPTENSDWTNSFWTGMLWLCGELTGDKSFYKAAQDTLPSFYRRIDERIRVDFHDLGFLYSLSCVAAYKLTGDLTARDYAIRAARLLCERFCPKGGFIQAWGEKDAPEDYRLIIDCYMNLPLLLWAAEQTGEKTFNDIALTHAKTAAETVFRADGSSFHTYWFDPKSGKPLRGATHQGYSDDSAWARGQAWGVCGLPLLGGRAGDLSGLWRATADYFFSKLPADSVPYWDLCFTDGSDMPRDTSASAIAVCGIFAAQGVMSGADEYLNRAYTVLESLIDNYSSPPAGSSALLSDGVYNKWMNLAPEATIFGDYFYLEALMRAKNPKWEMYWL